MDQTKLFSGHGLRFNGFRNVPKRFHVAIFVHATVSVNFGIDSGTDRGGYILDEMLDEINDSSLLNEVHSVYVTLLGCNRTYLHQKQRSLSLYYGDKVRIILDDSERKDESNVFEFPSLRAMQMYSKLAPPESVLLYIHTKGASGASGSLQSLGNDAWRRYLTYSLVWNYKQCLELVTRLSYETCGAQAQETPFRHYGGNMFFSTARYFAQTPPIIDWTVPRHTAESLLFSGGRDKDNNHNITKDGTHLSMGIGATKHYCMVNIFHHFYTCLTPRFLYQHPSYFNIRTSSSQCKVLKNAHNTKSFVEDFLMNSEREWVCLTGYYQPPLRGAAMPATWPYAVYAGRELVFDPRKDDWIQQRVRDDGGWFGHRGFAEWLVGTVKPSVVVDIGANEGYSTFVFASTLIALDNADRSEPLDSSTSERIDIDGDGGSILPETETEKETEKHARQVLRVNVRTAAAGDDVGTRFDQHIAKRLYRHIEDHSLGDIITVVDDFGDERSSPFSSAADPDPDGQGGFIDILHINGALDYESCKSYYIKWAPWVRAKGTVLLPYAFVSHAAVGVSRVFHEIEEKVFPYKGFFTNSFGMAVATRDADLFSRIKANFPDFIVGSLEQVGKFPIRGVVVIPENIPPSSDTSTRDSYSESDGKTGSSEYDIPFRRINNMVLQLFQEDGYKPTPKTFSGIITATWNELTTYMKQYAGTMSNITAPGDQHIWAAYVSHLISTKIRDELGLDAIDIEAVTGPLADLPIGDALSLVSAKRRS
jgi:hypothetical protein